MENLTYFNAMLAFVGWLAWIVGDLVLKKDDFDDADQDYSLRGHFRKNWDNWLFSFLFIILVLGGGDGLDVINSFDGSNIDWTNGFYMCPGPASYWALQKMKAIRKSKKKKPTLKKS